MNQKMVAREWLLFIGLLVGGLVVVPLALEIFFADFRWSMFCAALVDLDAADWWLAWLLVFAPYILVQLTRSLLWAARTMR